MFIINISWISYLEKNTGQLQSKCEHLAELQLSPNCNRFSYMYIE